jgi:hypothetical protein
MVEANPKTQQYSPNNKRQNNAVVLGWESRGRGVIG